MNTPSEDSIRSEESAVRRLSDRGHYDRATIDSILDAQLMCQIGFEWQGRVHVIPTLYGRDGDRVLFHGAAMSRMLEAAQQGPEICFSVTLLDALVLARSAFHHSANYRSVVLYGRPYLIEGDAAKNEALRKISEHFLPGRWDECRAPNAGELKATTVLALDIVEGAAKMRTHGAKDDPRDLDLDHWAGLLPITIVAGTPVPSEDLKVGVSMPESLSHLDALPFVGKQSAQ